MTTSKTSVRLIRIKPLTFGTCIYSTGLSIKPNFSALTCHQAPWGSLFRVFRSLAGLEVNFLNFAKKKKALQIVCFLVNIKWNWMINIRLLVELIVLSAGLKKTPEKAPWASKPRLSVELLWSHQQPWWASCFWRSCCSIPDKTNLKWTDWLWHLQM